MSEQILIALLGAAATVLAAIVGVVGTKLVRNVRRVRHQVENSHDSNLRDDIDEKHAETLRSIQTIHDALLGMRADIRANRVELQEHAQRLLRLEAHDRKRKP